MLLSNKSPPLGFIVAVIDFPPRVYFSKYSPPACFWAPPSSTNLKSPHVPGYLFSVVDDPVGPDGLLLVVLTEEFDEFADDGDELDDEVVADVDPRIISTPVSDDVPGNVPFSEPVPSESVF